MHVERVAELARAFASVLHQADIRRGERVLIALPDVPPFAWVLFATLAWGSVVAMANPDAPIEHIEALVEYSRATAVATPFCMLMRFRPSRQGRGRIQTVGRRRA